MFWLAIIGGGLILLHALLLLILKYRKKSSEKQRGYGALTFPRFEIFLVILALPCVCKASTSLVKGELYIHFSLSIIDIDSKSSALDIQLLSEAVSIWYSKKYYLYTLYRELYLVPYLLMFKGEHHQEL